MNLSEYLGDRHGAQTEIAQKIGCQPQLIWQWARNVRPIPIERCVPIETATAGAIRRWDLRPDDWHLIWPELIGANGSPPLQATANPAPLAIENIAKQET